MSLITCHEFRHGRQRRRRVIFVAQTQTKYRPVGAAYSAPIPDDVAPTELDLFMNRQATKISALTGFSQIGNRPPSLKNPRDGICRFDMFFPNDPHPASGHLLPFPWAKD